MDFELISHWQNKSYNPRDELDHKRHVIYVIIPLVKLNLHYFLNIYGEDKIVLFRERFLTPMKLYIFL